MSLRAILSDCWFAIQQELFPALKEELGPLGERYESLIAVLEFVRVERQLPYFHGLPGRPQEDRAALARAFIAKAVFDITTTRTLIERLAIDRPLRRLCGWSSVREVPSEATFSRAFAEPAAPGVARQHHAGSSGRAHLARFDGDRGTRETSPKAAPAGRTEAQAGPTAQG